MDAQLTSELDHGFTQCLIDVGTLAFLRHPAFDAAHGSYTLST
jgi:hypothetical protein